MASDRLRVRGLTIHRPIIYGNTATVLSSHERETSASPDHTHRWTVAVRSAASNPDIDQVGGADDLSYFIKRVTFKLYETYANPSRIVDKPPFEVTETGWGEFEIQIRITFVPEATEKTMVLYHHLKLHPWTLKSEPESLPPPIDLAEKMGPVHSWQYDELVFNDPYQNFLNILTDHPPTPLVKTKRKPVPFHLANPTSLPPPKDGTPEFNSQMEKEEADQLEEARKAVLAEHKHWMDELAKKDKKLKELQAQLNE